MSIAFIVFMAIAIGLLIGKGNQPCVKYSNVDYATDFVDEQCRQMPYNQSDLQKIDYLYDTGNSDLCKATCLCKASKV